MVVERSGSDWVCRVSSAFGPSASDYSQPHGYVSRSHSHSQSQHMTHMCLLPDARNIPGAVVGQKRFSGWIEPFNNMRTTCPHDKNKCNSLRDSRENARSKLIVKIPSNAHFFLISYTHTLTHLVALRLRTESTLIVRIQCSHSYICGIYVYIISFYVCIHHTLLICTPHKRDA